MPGGGGFTGKGGKRICGYGDCEKTAIFGVSGERMASRCVTHRLHGMLDVVNRKCESSGCKKQPSYGFQGQRPRRCAEHHLIDMINLYARHCAFGACTTRPSYGLPGKRATHCSMHRDEETMVNRMRRTCGHAGCSTTPSFGIQGVTGPTRCKAHVLESMTRIYDGHGLRTRPVAEKIDVPDTSVDDRRTEKWLSDLRMSDALGEVPENSRHVLWEWINGPGPTETEAEFVINAANGVARAFGSKEAFLMCYGGTPSWHDLAIAWKTVTSQLPTGAVSWIDPLGMGRFTTASMPLPLFSA